MMRIRRFSLTRGLPWGRLGHPDVNERRSRRLWHQGGVSWTALDWSLRHDGALSLSCAFLCPGSWAWLGRLEVRGVWRRRGRNCRLSEGVRDDQRLVGAANASAKCSYRVMGLIELLNTQIPTRELRRKLIRCQNWQSSWNWSMTISRRIYLVFTSWLWCLFLTPDSRLSPWPPSSSPEARPPGAQADHASPPGWRCAGAEVFSVTLSHLW